MQIIPDEFKSLLERLPRYRAKYFLWEFLLGVVVVLVLYGWDYVSR